MPEHTFFFLLVPDAENTAKEKQAISSSWNFLSSFNAERYRKHDVITLNTEAMIIL
jgi:hypothetical protein